MVIKGVGLPGIIAVTLRRSGESGPELGLRKWEMNGDLFAGSGWAGGGIVVLISLQGAGGEWQTARPYEARVNGGSLAGRSRTAEPLARLLGSGGGELVRQVCVSGGSE
jgi:hypothetical protein